MESPFQILRIDPEADDQEIDEAYRQRAMETHPDQGGSVREFRRVKAAYEEIRSKSRDSVPAGARDDIGAGSRHGAGPEQSESRVEYLNYEVLDDHGWDLDDDDLFEKASKVSLEPDDHGQFLVRPNETLLQAAENRGFAWPYACRGGACANCAVAVTDGELELPVDHILPPEMLDRGIRLSCVGAPTTEELSVVYNVKHLPDLDELRLPPHPFERARSDD